MDIFTTREISWILLWFIIFVLLISWEKTRPSVINVINSFFKKAIIYVLGITTIYSYVVIMIFKILGNILNIWNYIYTYRRTGPCSGPGVGRRKVSLVR